MVISRKKNESIVINDDITIVAVEIRGDKVRLGIVAPKETPIHRREVFDAIRRNELGRSIKPSGTRRSRRSAELCRLEEELAERLRSIDRLDLAKTDPTSFREWLRTSTEFLVTEDETDYIAKGAARAVKMTRVAAGGAQRP